MTTFMEVVSDLMSYFNQTIGKIDNQGGKIIEKYPKYLSKFSLFRLQIDDFLFRQTILVQILIFA